MSPFNFHKLLKFAKVVALIVVFVFFGVFLIIFVTTYLILNSTPADKRKTPKLIEAAIEATVDNISHPRSTKTNQLHSPKQDLARDTRIKQGIAFVKEIVALRDDQRLKSAPPICEVICKRSIWKKRAEGEEVWDQFNSFLAKEGSRAFDDPKFRLAFELVNLHADVVMVVGAALEEIEPIVQRKNELSEIEKIYWSAKAPIIIAGVVTQIKSLMPEGQKQNKIVKKLMELYKQCDTRSITEIEESCRAISEDSLKR